MPPMRRPASGTAQPRISSSDRFGAETVSRTLQSLCEFFSVVTRKSGIEASAAAAFLHGWRSVMPVEASTIADLDEAMRAVEAYGIGFWDALLWATVRRAGVRFLVSEDFQDGQTIEGV